MVSKTVSVFCVSFLFVQAISAQCLGSLNSGFVNGIGLGNAGLNGFGAANGIGAGYGSYGAANGCNGFSPATSGGGLVVQVSSPLAPSGISVVSENTIEGALEVGGQLPVLAAVAVEGVLPSGGAAGATYGCGSGQVGILSENGAAAGLNAANANAGLANAALANAGLANAGLANAGLANAGLANGALANAGIANAGFANQALAGANFRGNGCGRY